MFMSRCLSPVACGVILHMMSWLIFIPRPATSLPVQNVNEILQSVGSGDGYLKTDHESEYALGHKAWKPRNVEKEVPANREIVNRNPRLFIVTKDHADTEQANRTSFERPGKKPSPDPWSMIWYLVAFFGLAVFFLAVTFADCCFCNRPAGLPLSTSPTSPEGERTTESTPWEEETPPPPYHLFAPPSYDNLYYASGRDHMNKCEVYVVPDHGPMVALHEMTSSGHTEPRWLV